MNALGVLDKVLIRELLRTTEHQDHVRKWYAPPKPRAVEMQGGVRRFAPHQADLFFFWTATCRRKAAKPVWLCLGCRPERCEILTIGHWGTTPCERCGTRPAELVPASVVEAMEEAKQRAAEELERMEREFEYTDYV